MNISTVVFGNHKKKNLTREDTYAPVLLAASARLLTSMAI